MHEGCSSVGLDAARSVPLGAEGLEVATSPTEIGPGLGATSMVDDLGWYLEIPGTGTGLVEILFYPCKPGSVSQTTCGSGGVVCCLLKDDAWF